MASLSHLSVNGGCDAPLSFLPAAGLVFDLRGGGAAGSEVLLATTSSVSSTSRSSSQRLWSQALSRSGHRRDVSKRVTAATTTTRSARLRDACQRAAARWYRLPQVSRYFVSGNLGNVCFFLLEKTIHRFLHEQRDDVIPAYLPVSKHTVSFLVAYMAQVVPQHFLHALLVYGLDTVNTPAKYARTLAGTYSAFAASMVGSTALNSVLIRFWTKDAAFVSTIVVFAVINYFVISWIVRMTSRSSRVAMGAPSTARTARSRRKEKDSNHGDNGNGLLAHLLSRGGGSGTVPATMQRSLSAEDWHLIESNVVDLT